MNGERERKREGEVFRGGEFLGLSLVCEKCAGCMI